MPETYDYESITVAGTAIGFTVSKLAPANRSAPSRVVCVLEVAQVRYRADGTDPTAAEGQLLNVGDTLILDSLNDMNEFRAIRTGGVSGILKVSFESGR